MTPNQLQFQPGLSLTDFLHDYGTQAQCEAALEKSRWPRGYTCPACESRSHCIVWHEFRCRTYPACPCRVASRSGLCQYRYVPPCTEQENRLRFPAAANKCISAPRSSRCSILPWFPWESPSDRSGWPMKNIRGSAAMPNPQPHFPGDILPPQSNRRNWD